MRSSKPSLQVFLEVVGLELVGICIDKFGSEDFYGFVENHVDYLIWVYEYLLGVRNPLNFPSCVYVWVMKHFGVVLGGFHGGF